MLKLKDSTFLNRYYSEVPQLLAALKYYLTLPQPVTIDAIRQEMEGVENRPFRDHITKLYNLPLVETALNKEELKLFSTLFDYLNPNPYTQKGAFLPSSEPFKNDMEGVNKDISLFVYERIGHKQQGEYFLKVKLNGLKQSLITSVELKIKEGTINVIKYPPTNKVGSEDTLICNLGGTEGKNIYSKGDEGLIYMVVNIGFDKQPKDGDSFAGIATFKGLNGSIALTAEFNYTF